MPGSRHLPLDQIAALLAPSWSCEPSSQLVSDGSTGGRRFEMTPGSHLTGGLPMIFPFEFICPTTAPSQRAFVCGTTNAAGASPDTVANAMFLALDGNGALELMQLGATGADYRRAVLSGSVTRYGGQPVRGAVVFQNPNSASFPTIIILGEDATGRFSPSTLGSFKNWLPPELETSRLVSFQRWPFGIGVHHTPIIGTMPIADVIAWTLSGRWPSWFYNSIGSAVGYTNGSGLSGRTTTNYSFEDSSVGVLPTGWEQLGNHTALTVADGSAPHGSKVCEITSTGTGELFANHIRHNIAGGIAFNRRELLSFWAKSVSGNTSLTYEIGGGSGWQPSTVALTNTWQRFFASATTTAAAGYLRFALGGAGVFQLDKVEVIDSGTLARHRFQPGSTFAPDFGPNGLHGTVYAGLSVHASNDRLPALRYSANNRLMVVGLPTSSAGLASGEIWNDAGALKIVP